ncbi:MAG: hypothetical protein IJK26_09510 [Clostridia bacterium]|nr:hypothetical protein [Clostridia bacterium]
MFTENQKRAIDETYDKLNEFTRSDIGDLEMEHIHADEAIITLLRQLGAGKVADFYEERTSYYYYA